SRICAVNSSTSVPQDATLPAPVKTWTVLGSRTLTSSSSKPEPPSLSVTVTRTVYCPGAGYAWLPVMGFACELVLPPLVAPSPHAIVYDHGLSVAPGSVKRAL